MYHSINSFLSYQLIQHFSAVKKYIFFDIFIDFYPIYSMNANHQIAATSLRQGRIICVVMNPYYTPYIRKNDSTYLLLDKVLSLFRALSSVFTSSFFLPSSFSRSFVSFILKPLWFIASLVTCLEIFWYVFVFKCVGGKRSFSVTSNSFSHLFVGFSSTLSTELQFSMYFCTIYLITEATTAAHWRLISFNDFVVVIVSTNSETKNCIPTCMKFSWRLTLRLLVPFSLGSEFSSFDTASWSTV